MKLSLANLARAIGDSRADFYSFYAPSWATPAGLERMRAEIAAAQPTGASLHRPARVHPLPPRSSRDDVSPLPHAA